MLQRVFQDNTGKSLQEGGWATTNKVKRETHLNLNEDCAPLDLDRSHCTGLTAVCGQRWCEQKLSQTLILENLESSTRIHISRAEILKKRLLVLTTELLLLRAACLVRVLSLMPRGCSIPALRDNTRDAQTRSGWAWGLCSAQRALGPALPAGPPKPRPGSCRSASPRASAGPEPGDRERERRPASLAWGPSQHLRPQPGSPAAAPPPDGTSRSHGPHANVGKPAPSAPLPGTGSSRAAAAPGGAETPSHRASTPRSARPPWPCGA